MRYSAEYNINDMNDPVGRPVVHLDDVAARGLALDGDVGPAQLLHHADLLPRPRHHGVRAGVQGRGEDEACRHVAEQSGLQHIGLGQKHL